MMIDQINKFVVFLVSGTGKMNGYLNGKSNSNTNYILNHAKSGNHLSFSPTLGFIKTLSDATKIFDWVSLITILIGLGIVISSLLGNNGKWRKTGFGMIISGYVWVISTHTIIVGAPAFGNLGNMKVMIFIMMLIGQLLFYVGSSTLFTIGSQQLELYEMSGQPSSDRRQMAMYNYMIITMIGGAFAYFIAGLF